MADWFGSGRAVDFILALVVAEGVALALLWRWTGHGLRWRDHWKTARP